MFDTVEGDSPFRINIESAGLINLENLNSELNQGAGDKISNSLSKEGDDGEEEQIPVREQPLEIDDGGSDPTFTPASQGFNINLNKISAIRDSARTNSDLDSFKAYRPQVRAKSEYPGSFEDANPEKLNTKIHSLATLIRNHDIVNYTYSLNRDNSLSTSLTDSLTNLFSTLESFFEKISDRLPIESLSRIADKSQRFAMSLGNFDSNRDDEFKGRLRLRFKPLTNQRSSQKNS